MSKAYRWLMVLGTLGQHGPLNPIAILQQAAMGSPVPGGTEGLVWSFADGSTLTVDNGGVWATAPRTRVS